MRLPRLLAAVPGLIAAIPGFAQRHPNDTPLYTPQPPAELDKNYGLPTFGMPGNEVPRPPAMAPEAEMSDFFKGSTDFTQSPASGPAPAGSTAETPLYTSTEGLTTGETTSDRSSTGGLTTGGATTEEATTDGFTTRDADAPAGKADR